MTNLLQIYTLYIKTPQLEFADLFWQSRLFISSRIETCPLLKPFLTRTLLSQV